MRKRILVTGSGGFIGRHLTAYLSSKDYEVVPFAGDVTKKIDIDGEIDAVYHLAAKTFIGYCTLNPKETMDVNFGGVLKGLECAREKKAKFIFASAAAVYGANNEGLSEDFPAKPNNVYGLSKYLAEQLCEFYAKYLEIPCVVLRLFNVYGAGQRGEFLLPTLVQNIQKGQTIELRSPKSVRDFIYIDDVLSAFELCVEKNFEAKFNLFNIGSGKGYSVEEVVGIIKSVSGKDAAVKSDETAEGDVSTADISKAKKFLGWGPKVSFEEGIRKMLAEV
ncbi:MAG: GDP-mannose 4,6-dehydratase [bacterium]|nr:GDP-mannose 4,6-dehydratase [bacterium]